MPNWKKVIISGSDAALNSLNVSTSLTASGLIYPATDGASNQVLKTDGAGNLFFDNVITTTISIKNVSGGTIQKGTPCYITGSGTLGNVAGVWPADASNPLRMPAGVIAGEDLIAGAEGIGLLNGFINGVDTSTFNSGDSVYVAAGGGYTNIRPTGSSILVQKLGNVEKVDNSNGSGVIHGPGYYNDLPNIQQGFTWVGSGDGVATAIATSSIQNVVSSSFASTASYVNPLNQNVLITGSLSVQDTSTGVNVLDTKTYVLRGTNVNTSLDWAGRTLNSSAGTEVLSWRFLRGLDSTGKLSYSWANRTLNDTNATSSIDWNLRTAYDALGTGSAYWDARQLRDSTDKRSILWHTRTALDTAERTSIDWRNRQLIDGSGTTVVLDWQSLKANSTDTSQSIDWNNRLLTDDGTPSGLGIPQLSIDWQNRSLNDLVAGPSIDWANRALYDLSSIPSMDYSNRDLIDSAGQSAVQYDIQSNVSAIQQFAWTRALIDIPTVAEPLAYWSNYNKYLPTGEILTGVTFDGSVVDYDLVGMREDGIWYPQDASSANVAPKLLGLAFNVAFGDYVLLEGTAVVASSSFGSTFPKVDKLQFGAPVYLNTTSSAGNYMSTTAPSLPGQYVRILGHVYYRSTNDSDYYLMKFKPSHEWYEI